MSDYEKYLAVYNRVKQYKKYKENPNDLSQSRDFKYILTGDYMVCVGYAKLLEELCKRVGIQCMKISATVDISYDNGFTLENKTVEYGGHARNLVRIDDDKYNIHGIYVCDSTWDNDLETDFYLNSTMTFDRKKESIRLEKLNKYDFLLDFHNLEEFNTKVEKYINLKIESRKSHEFYDSEIDIIKSASLEVFDDVYNILFEFDRQEHDLFKEKYKGISFVKDYKDIIKSTYQMLNEYANYMLPLVNKEISFGTVMSAAKEVKKNLGYSLDELKEWEEKTIDINISKADKYFPYQYEYNNETDEYVPENYKSR